MLLFIKSHKQSLERIERNGHIVKIIGKGIMKSPGHPAGNQDFDNQLDLFQNASRKPFIFVIYKDKEFLGQYILLNHMIKISFEGFRYYEFTMSRVSQNKPIVVHEVLDD